VEKRRHALGWAGEDGFDAHHGPAALGHVLGVLTDVHLDVWVARVDIPPLFDMMQLGDTTFQLAHEQTAHRFCLVVIAQARHKGKHGGGNGNPEGEKKV
jgi:hypothetical protein